MNSLKLKLEFPLLPEYAHRHAETFVLQSWDNAQIQLNYSIDSLKAVDSLLESWLDQGTQLEEIPSTLFRIGCYVGEVVRRLRSAEWVTAADFPQENDSHPLPALLMLKFPDGHVWSPIRTAFLKASRGREISLVLACQDQLARAEIAHDDIERVGGVAGFAMAQTIAALCNRGESEPVLAVEFESGQQTHQQFVGWDSFLAALQAARAQMAAPTAGTRIKVLVYHAEYELGGRRGHAVFAEIGAPALLVGLTLAVHYQPATSGSAAHFQALEVWQAPAHVRGLANTVLHRAVAGAQKHAPAWKAWQEHTVGGSSENPAELADDPNVFWMLDPAGKPARLDFRIEIAAKVAELPPELRNYAKIQAPEWMQYDQLARLIDHFPILLREGRVVWGHLVQANQRLFEPDPHNLPAEVLYAPHHKVGPDQLAKVVQQLANPKGRQRDDPAFASIAEHLANERTRAFAMPIPATFTDGVTMVMSTMLICRTHLPVSHLVLPYFPLLISDQCPGSTMVLPSRWWPAVLADVWRGQIQPVQ